MTEIDRAETKKNKTPLLPGVFTALLGSFFVFLYVPLQQFIQNTDDFIYDFRDLVRMTVPVWLCAFAVMLAVLLLTRLVSGGLYAIALSGFLWIIVSMYLEGTFLSGFLPALDGSSIDWEGLSAHRLPSVLVWTVSGLVIASLLLIFKKDRMFSLASYIGGFGMAMLVLTLVFSLNAEVMRDRQDFYASERKMFELSENGNLIVFVLDTIDGDDFNSALEANPEYAEQLKDFTFFRNTLGAYPGTKWAVPFMLSGRWYENEEGYFSYRERAYCDSPFFAKLKERGFSVCDYDEELPPVEQLTAVFENLDQPDTDEFMHPSEFRKMQVMLTGLQVLPFDMKRFCVLTPDNIYYDSLKKTDGDGQFSWGNDLFLGKLSASDITLTQEPCFRLYHLQGSHVPFDYQYSMEGNYSGTYEDAEAICIRIIKEYADKLKAAGIYDSTAIFVTGDHGHKPDVVYNMNPALFVKGMNESHAFAISDAPVSHEDFAEAFLRLTDGKKADEIFDVREGDLRERRFISTYMWDDDHLVEFTQRGEARDSANLVKTGRIFTPDGIIYSDGA